MSTKARITIRTHGPGPNLGDLTDTSSPAIDAVTAILQDKLGVAVESASHRPTPRIFPPWYIIDVVTAASFDKDVLVKALEENWTSNQAGDESFPSANFQVDDVEE